MVTVILGPPINRFQLLIAQPQQTGIPTADITTRTVSVILGPPTSRLLHLIVQLPATLRAPVTGTIFSTNMVIYHTEFATVGTAAATL